MINLSSTIVPQRNIKENIIKQSIVDIYLFKNIFEHILFSRLCARHGDYTGK